MKFYTTKWPRHWAPGEPAYPHILLIEQNWNDFGFLTLFEVRYVKTKNREEALGGIKILRRGQREGERPGVDSEFEQLPDTFCSLGQGLEYYRAMNRLPANTGREVLAGLNDVALDQQRRQVFEDERGFETSLLRSPEVRRAMEVGGEILAGTLQPLDHLDFGFSCQLRGAEKPHRVHFTFSAESALPLRFNVLVGANGTGKTELLARLALALTAGPKSEGHGEFTSRPLTSRIIAISYNALDTFRIPEPGTEARIGYKYCGLRTRDILLFSVSGDASSRLNETRIPDELAPFLKGHIDGSTEEWKVTTLREGRLWRVCGESTSIRLEQANDGILKGFGEGLQDTASLLSRVSQSLENLDSLRGRKLRTLLSRVLPEHCDIKRFVGMGEGTYRRSVFLNLSAGQRIVCSIVCDVVSFIEQESLLLVDEPENHLHPGLVSTLMALLQDILDEYSSFAIVATHSPVVLQQVPSQCVRVLRRVGNTPFVDPLSFECFGENLQTITEKALGLAEPELDFHDRLRELSEAKTFDEITGLFERGLSLGARVYLRSLAASRREGRGGGQHRRGD